MGWVFIVVWTSIGLVWVGLTAVTQYGHGRAVGRVQGACDMLNHWADQLDKDGHADMAQTMREQALASAFFGGSRLDRFCDRVDEGAMRRHAERQAKKAQ